VSPEAASCYDLDSVQSWCASAETSADCATLLDAWNLLTDLPDTRDLFAAADSRADTIYDKLFHGCNLPVMGGATHYVPTWTRGEIEALKHLLLLGINNVRSRLHHGRAVEQGVAADGLLPPFGRSEGRR
jgi:hypothetical protein